MLQAGGSKALGKETGVRKEVQAPLFGESLRKVLRDQAREVGKGHFSKALVLFYCEGDGELLKDAKL